MTSQRVGSVLPHFLVSDRHYDLFHLFALNHPLISIAFVRNFTKCFWVSLLLHIFKVQFNLGPETTYPKWGFSLLILNSVRHIVVAPHIGPWFFIIYPQFCQTYCGSTSYWAMTMPFHILSNSLVMLPFGCYVFCVTFLFLCCNHCRRKGRDYAHCYRNEYIPLLDGRTYHKG